MEITWKSIVFNECRFDFFRAKVHYILWQHKLRLMNYPLVPGKHSLKHKLT